MKKPFLVAGIIAILLFLGGGVWYGNNFRTESRMPSQQVQVSQEQPPVQPSPEDEVASIRDLIDGEYHFDPVDTSDWQTYRNDQLRFEVKMPNNWFCGGIALDPNSDKSIVCLENSQRENYYEGKYKGNNLIMVNRRSANDTPLGDRENLTFYKKNNNLIYEAVIDSKEILIMVDNSNKYRTAFDISGNLDITAFPSVNHKVFDGFLKNFHFEAR